MFFFFFAGKRAALIEKNNHLPLGGAVADAVVNGRLLLISSELQDVSYKLLEQARSTAILYVETYRSL